MLGKLLENLYPKIFINIIINRSKTTVYIEVYDKNAVINRVEDSFNTTKLNNRMRDLITLYTRETPYNYISVLDTSASQGAIPVCNKDEMSSFFNVEASSYKCYDEKWLYYTSKSDINLMKVYYKTIGLDFIFSPFTLLAKFFKDKIDSNVALYVLVEDNCVCVSVFNHSSLLFAEHLNIEADIEADELSMEDDLDDMELDLDLDGVVDLEDVDAVEDIDSLDDFTDIEDLSDFEEIDEFSEAQEDEVSTSNKTDTDESDLAGLNEDYQRFSLIQKSVNNFYKDRRFESRFIESVYIADSVGVSSDLKRYLEEEMFLSVYIRNINLAVEVCEMAKVELK